MIGIIIAMETETNNLLNMKFDFIEEINMFGKKIYKIKQKNNEFIICFCGIGKVNAAVFTSLIINNFSIENIINIGSAGVYDNANVGEIILANKIFYGDVDVTGFGYEINQVPKMPLFYESNKSFIKKISQIIKYNCLEGNIYTSDSFINTNNVNKFVINKDNVPTLIEMEACAIAQTCFILKKEFLAIKIAIDKVFEPIKNEEQFNNNLLETSMKIDNIVLEIINNW